MKRYETRVQPAREFQKLVARTCDLCGALATNDDWDKHKNWTGEYGEVDATEFRYTIKHEKGTSYPDCGDSTTYEVDICPDCFRKKLLPWLREQGAKIEPEEIIW